MFALTVSLGFCLPPSAAEAERYALVEPMSGPALRSRGPQGQTKAAAGGCRAEQTCERRSIAAASKAGRGPQKNIACLLMKTGDE